MHFIKFEKNKKKEMFSRVLKLQLLLHQATDIDKLNTNMSFFYQPTFQLGDYWLQNFNIRTLFERNFETLNVKIF